MCIKFSGILLLFPKSISKWIGHPQGLIINYMILAILTVIINSKNYLDEQDFEMIHQSNNCRGDPLKIKKIDNFTWDQNQQTVRINVSWDPPTDERLTHYQLYWNCYDCQNKDFELVSKYPKNKTSIILPNTEKGKMELNCTYDLKITSSFEDASKWTSTIINFTLPTCIEYHCSCHYFKRLNISGLFNIVDNNKKLELRKPDNIDSCCSNQTWNEKIYFFIEYVLYDKNNDKETEKTHIVTLNLTEHVYNSSIVSDTNTVCVTLKSTYCSSERDCKLITPDKTLREPDPTMENITSSMTSYPETLREPDPTTENITSSILSYPPPKHKDMHISSKLLIALVIMIALSFICHIYRKRQQTDLRGALRRRSLGGVWQPYHCPRSLCSMSEINPQYEYSQGIKGRGVADDYEIDYSRLKFGIEIGKGAFGRVFLVQVEATKESPGFSKVAVKKLKRDASPDEIEGFLTEISMLKRVGHHPNIVTLLGCCTVQQPYCMLMEFVPYGDLHAYLHKLRHYVEMRRVIRYHQQQHQPLTNQQQLTNQFQQQPTNHTQCGGYQIKNLTSNSDCSYITLPNSLPVGERVSVTETEYTDISSEGTPGTPTVKNQRAEEFEIDSKELQNFALQIAKGMAHLEEKQITHRDLAARNVLIDKNKVLKISDFGLSRTGIYINAKNKKVPLRWLSIEAIRDNLYSSKSDVWAFAVVLWEIATLGAFPYGILSNSELLPYLLDDKRLEKPDNLTSEIYSLMLRCWSPLPDLRPSFSELVTILDSTGRKKIYVDFENIDSTYVFPPTEQQTLKQENSA